MPAVFPALSAAPHAFQQQVLDHLSDWYSDRQIKHKLVSSPTGTGKSFLALWMHQRHYPDSWIVTPKVEIIEGMFDKLGVPFSEENMIDYQIITPLKFINRMMDGRVDASPELIIKDEAHHNEADTYSKLDALLPDTCLHLGLTGSPFRGTPKGTYALLQTWGEPYKAITYAQAFAKGYLSRPDYITMPLVDDDLVEVSSTGEFVVNKLVSDVNDKVEHAIRQNLKRFDMPSIIGVPSSGCFPAVNAACMQYDIKVNFVSQETSRAERRRAFDEARRAQAAICHINVVSEGVDLPLRFYLDLAPTMSPVLFVQRIGRIMRPGGHSVYVCTNRNLERHGYLLEGTLKTEEIKSAQTAFLKPSERTKSRVFGLESMGKLQPCYIELSSGIIVTFFGVTQVVENRKFSYAVILHPSHPGGAWFKKVDEQNRWGSYEPCEMPKGLTGFASVKPSPLTEKQAKWWNRDAAKHGLMVEQKLDAKKFQILPVLAHNELVLE